jgi:hypothetical protein
MRTQGESSNKRDLVLFVLFVLILAWTPMMLSNPLPKNTVSARVLENPSALFPEIPGYSKSTMTSVKSTLHNEGAEYRVEYRSNEDNLPVWVFMQRTHTPQSSEPAETIYRSTDWVIKEWSEEQLEEMPTQNLRLEKDNEIRDASLIYFKVIKESPRFFIFQSSDEGGEVLRIAIETPSDEKAKRRIEEVASSLIRHVR